MNKLFISATILILSFGITEPLSSQPAEEFINRRKEVIKRMEPGSVLILRSSPMAGMFDYARQGGNIYYLTGIDEPYCLLVLFAENFQMPANKFTEGNEIFFIRPINSDRINWDPQTPGLEGAGTKSGIVDIRSNNEAQEFTGRLLAYNLPAIYMDVERSASINTPLSGDEQVIKIARDHGAAFRIQSPASILNPILSKKSPSEIGLMRTVVNITAQAQREAARSLRPGMYEYQLDALIRYIFSINGSGSVSFPGIIGSGINSVILHWMENSRKMEEGELVVVDCGAENQMYCADITRTYPVSGKYSNRQKAVYEIVLKANEEAIKMVAPGVKMADISSVADSVLADGMLRIGLIKDKKDFKRYYYHGLSHQIGLKGAFGGQVSVLESGMIITIEPGIYVREEKTGIRIEDDVLVTTTGYEVLSKDSPKQIAEIEKLMKEEGIDVLKNVLK
jgi:Xaa-Pro aminopeptidase